MLHNLFDSHIHSDNSLDGAHSVIYMAERAESVGLTGIAVTDHVDCVYLKKPGYRNRIIQSVVDVAKAKAAFRHRMSFAAGVEIGVYGDFDAASKVAGMYPFDYVLATTHTRPDGSSYYRADYGALSPQERYEVLAEYLEILLGTVEWGGFDALAHLTYPLRCAIRSHGVRLDLEPHTELVEMILKGLAQRGKALELNTSGLRSPLKETMPPLWVLKRFKELGGEYVTIGSDAHRAEDVGAGIEAGMELIQEAGFDFFAFYRERRPVMLRVV